jgi:uncharacterized protein
VYFRDYLKNEGMYFEKSTIGNNKFWTYLVTIILVIIFSQIIGSIPIGIVIATKRLAGGAGESSNLLNPAALGIDMNFFLLLMIIPFVIGLIALWFGIDSIHKKKAIDVLTGRNKFDWNRVFFAAAIWGALYFITAFASYLNDPASYEIQFQPIKFIILFFIAFLFIPLQSSMEEIFFRGYLMQGISLLSKNKWIPLLITSIIFGLMHIANPEVKEFGVGIMLPQYILLGLFFGVMVIMDDGLELALGVHAINNIFSALFVTHKSSALQTPAIFKTASINPGFEFITLGFAVIVFIVIVSKKYKWNNWKTIFAKLEFSKAQE